MNHLYAVSGRAALFAATILLSSCAFPHHVSPEVIEKAKIPLVCHDQIQCDRYWGRAREWLVKNSRYPIRTDTDSIIATANPAEVSPYLVFKVKRLANPDGSSSIKISAECGSELGCIPDKWETIKQFKSFIVEENE